MPSTRVVLGLLGIGTALVLFLGGAPGAGDDRAGVNIGDVAVVAARDIPHLVTSLPPSTEMLLSIKELRGSAFVGDLIGDRRDGTIRRYPEAALNDLIVERSKIAAVLSSADLAG